MIGQEREKKYLLVVSALLLGLFVSFLIEYFLFSFLESKLITQIKEIQNLKQTKGKNLDLKKEEKILFSYEKLFEKEFNKNPIDLAVSLQNLEKRTLDELASKIKEEVTKLEGEVTNVRKENELLKVEIKIPQKNWISFLNFYNQELIFLRTSKLNLSFENGFYHLHLYLQ